VILLLGLAAAQELPPEPPPPPETEAVAPGPETYTGRMVALRTLVAPGGGLPEEDLEPLLLVRQDRPYLPAEARQDIQMLQRVGEFAQVEVDVEDWVLFDEGGAPIPAVRVEYRVYQPPRVGRVQVRGPRHLRARTVAGAAGLEAGEAWFAGDAEAAEARVEDFYAEHGWLEADARITSAPAATPGLLDLVLTVDEGPARRLRAVSLSTGGALAPFQTRWILARHGLVRGRPFPDAAVERARAALEGAARRAGWYEARVALSAEPTEGGANLAVLVDPGRVWEITTGRDRPTEAQVVAALDLDRGVRLTRTWEEDAGRALTGVIHDEGYVEADLRVRLQTDVGRVELQVEGNRGARHRLRHVRFEGAEGETDRVWSRRYMRDAFREASADVFVRRRVTPEAIDRALAQLREFYRAQGYLGVSLSRESFDEGHRRGVVPVDVRVKVEPGPRAILRQVELSGDVPEGVDAGAYFADLVGRPLNPAELDVRARRLVEALAELGHLGADARARATVSADGLAGVATIEVDAGPEVYVRSVLIRGNERTRRRVIAREIDLASGDRLAPSRVAAIRRRLYDVGVFSRVGVELEGDEDRVKDLVVEVEEKKNLYAELGGGLATDQGARLFLRGGHRNLWGLGHRFTAVGQASVGWVGDQWSFDWLEPEWRAALRYEAPGVPTRGESVAVDVLLNEELQEPSFRLARSGAGVGLLLRLGPNGRAEIAYRVQARRLLDVDPGVLVAGDPWLDALAVEDLADPRPVTPTGARLQSGLSVSLLLDLRDDPFNPTTGGVGSLGVDIADRLATDVSFLRTHGAWTSYLPLAGSTLLTRVQGGVAVVPDGAATLPVEDRFRLGGGASLRGFALDSVGPANEVSPERVTTPDALGPLLDLADRDGSARWVPTGGDAMAVGTLELQIPFGQLGLSGWEGTSVAVFGDVGNVWWVSPLVTADSEQVPGMNPALRWSVGVGLRRVTAVGPIALDLGFNPGRVAEREETVARVHFSLGAL